MWKLFIAAIAATGYIIANWTRSEKTQEQETEFDERKKQKEEERLAEQRKQKEDKERKENNLFNKWKEEDTSRAQKSIMDYREWLVEQRKRKEFEERFRVQGELESWLLEWRKKPLKGRSKQELLNAKRYLTGVLNNSLCGLSSSFNPENLRRDLEMITRELMGGNSAECSSAEDLPGYIRKEDV